MDQLDLGILKALLVNNGVPPGVPILRKSFRTLAKELGVDQHTIRTRMRRLQEGRILRGWYLGQSPGLTGHDVAHVWFRVENEDSKGELIQRLLPIQGLERVCNYLGPEVSLILFCERGADPVHATKEVSKLAGPGVTLCRRIVFGVQPFRTSKVDEAIIRSLEQDPWKPYPSVARELRLSARTVRRRVENLVQGGAVYMLPIIDLRAMHGVIPAELTVEYGPRATKPSVNEQIIRSLKDELVFADTSGPVGYFALTISNVSQVEEVKKWVEGLEGVLHAHVRVLQDVILNRNHYGELAPQPEKVAQKHRQVASTSAFASSRP